MGNRSDIMIAICTMEENMKQCEYALSILDPNDAANHPSIQSWKKIHKSMELGHEAICEKLERDFAAPIQFKELKFLIGSTVWFVDERDEIKVRVILVKVDGANITVKSTQKLSDITSFGVKKDGKEHQRFYMYEPCVPWKE